MAANHLYAENIPRLFRLQEYLRRKSSLSRNNSKTFSPARLSWPKTIFMLKTFKDFFACKSCLSRKSSLSWKNSKSFSPAKLSYSQFFITLINFKDFFACKIVLDTNRHYPENIQRLFRLQDCLGRKPSLCYSKTFSPASKVVLDTNRHYPENIQRLFRLQDCLGRKPSLCWKYSKFFSLGLSRKSPLSWKNSKTFSPAKVSYSQFIFMLKKFKDFFTFLLAKLS